MRIRAPKDQITVGLLIVGLVSTGCAASQPIPASAPLPAATVTPAPTLVSDALDEPLLPPFTPSYPCELQNDLATVSDESYCRSEQITEVIAADGDGVVFIQQTHHLGYGCWTGINSYQYALFTCDTGSGERTRLFDQPTTPLVASPDGEWLAFGTFDQMNFDAFVYKIRIDSTDLQRLDKHGLPGLTVSVNILGWSVDGKWINLSVWDGTEDGWHPIRLRADGSGEFAPIPGDK